MVTLRLRACRRRSLRGPPGSGVPAGPTSIRGAVACAGGASRFLRLRATIGLLFLSRTPVERPLCDAERGVDRHPQRHHGRNGQRPPDNPVAQHRDDGGLHRLPCYALRHFVASSRPVVGSASFHPSRSRISLTPSRNIAAIG